MDHWPGGFELPDPALVGPRVLLRPWSVDDAPQLVQAWADPEIAAWTAVPPEPTDAYARRWIAADGQRRRKGLCLDLVVAPVHAEGTLVGEVGLVPVGGTDIEIGYWVTASERGNGYATDAATLLARWADEQLGARVTAQIPPENTPPVGLPPRRRSELGVDAWGRVGSRVPTRP